MLQKIPNPAWKWLEQIKDHQSDILAKQVSTEICSDEDPPMVKSGIWHNRREKKNERAENIFWDTQVSIPGGYFLILIYRRINDDEPYRSCQLISYSSFVIQLTKGVTWYRLSKHVGDAPWLDMFRQKSLLTLWPICMMVVCSPMPDLFLDPEVGILIGISTIKWRASAKEGDRPIN